MESERQERGLMSNSDREPAFRAVRAQGGAQRDEGAAVQRVPGFADSGAPTEEVLAGELAEAAEGAGTVVALDAEATIRKDSWFRARGGGSCC